jgi:hypothetical protein
LVQVNFPLLGFMSSSSQSKMRSSTHSLAGSLTGEPPLFSERAKVTLRSPARTIFSWGLRDRKLFMESQHSFFLDTIIGT